MNLDILKDRRVLYTAVGGVVALMAGLLIGMGLLSRHGAAPKAPAEPGSLQVQMGKDDPSLDPKKPLRCFVNGQFVGMVSLPECARKNGVATGSLDVGLDPNGEVAAASDTSVLQPLPGAPAPPPVQAAATGEAAAPPAPSDAPVAAAASATGATAACWRYAGDWRRIADDMSLDNCVQALFAGRCERPGGADYGRWNGDTLRLVTGKVERAGDNRSFRTLVKQASGDCSIPRLGD